MLEDDMLTKWDSSKLVIYRIHNYQDTYMKVYLMEDSKSALKILELYFHEIAPKLLQYHAKTGSKEKYEQIKRGFGNIKSMGNNNPNLWGRISELHLLIQEGANLVGLHAGDKESNAGL